MNESREAKCILRSGNAPKRRGGQVPKARRSRPQGPAREPKRSELTSKIEWAQVIHYLRATGRGPKFTFGNGALGRIHKLRSAGLSRRRLRALRVRLRRIYPPLRFGAFPLRRITFASRESFISAELSGCFYLEEVSSRPPLVCRDRLSCLLTLPKAAQEDNLTH